MASGSSSRCVSLPVVDDAGSKRSIKRSRMGPWRAGVLVGVHVIFLVHIAQWLLTGMTVSPVEPSESMETLEHGVVNAGFVFFVLAIVSTLIFGRFFCGWACHVVALQDLCALLMRRAKVKPKPFRSRLLVFAPLAFGLYMFVWPTFKRVALAPGLRAAGLDMPLWLSPAPDPHGVTAGFLVPDFWATFPPWYVAIPFLFICGFAVVYFMGAKGFCTYGCPYGGIFAPADSVAPVRIRVTDACEHCGHCTAVCTSNVRVHEEVRDFGMVVDPGCMKCMDCVSVCPKDALYVGIGRPALGASPRNADSHRKTVESRRRRYDMTWPEEIVAATVFLLMFLCFRGMLDSVPMLMAIGVSAVATFLLVTAWRVMREPNVRVHKHQLRLRGGVRPWGFVALAVAVVTVALAIWSGQARWHRWWSQTAYMGLDVPIAVVLRPDFEPTAHERRLAERGAAMAERADGFTSGGWGWRLDPDGVLRLAYMRLLQGDFEGADTALQRVIERGRPLAPVVFQRAQIMARLGATEADIDAMQRDAIDRHPGLHAVRAAVASRAALQGNLAQADAIHEGALADRPDDLPVLLDAARYFTLTDRAQRARMILADAEVIANDSHTIDVARSYAVAGDHDNAKRLCRRAASIEGGDKTPVAALLIELGEPQEAIELLELIEPTDAASLAARADISAKLGRLDDARGALITAGGGAESPWDIASVAARLLRLAEVTGDGRSLDAAVDLYAKAAAAEPESATLRHDYGAALFAAGRDNEAVAELEAACDLAPTRAVFAQRLGVMLGQLGRLDESARWTEEARRRSGG